MMASKRKQATLFKYNFKRKVEHKGTPVEIKGKDFLDNKSGIFSCTNCKDSFLGKQGNLFKFFSCNFSIFCLQTLVKVFFSYCSFMNQSFSSYCSSMNI